MENKVQNCVEQAKSMLDKFPKLSSLLKALGVDQEELTPGGSADFTYDFAFVLEKTQLIRHWPIHGSLHRTEEVIYKDSAHELCEHVEEYKEFKLFAVKDTYGEAILAVLVTDKNNQKGKQKEFFYTLDGIPGTMFVNILGDHVVSICWQHYNSKLLSQKLPFFNISFEGDEIDLNNLVSQFLEKGKKDLDQLKETIITRRREAEELIHQLETTYPKVLRKERR